MRQLKTNKKTPVSILAASIALALYVAPVAAQQQQDPPPATAEAKDLDKITVVGTFPADSHAPIIYPAALLTTAADDADRAFYQALSSDASDAIFAAQGFAILN